MSKYPLRKGQQVRLWGLSLALLSGLLGFIPADAPAECKQAVVQAYRKLEGALAAGAEQRVFHLQFTSESTYTAPGQRTEQKSIVRGELYSQGRKGVFKTDEMSIWQDGQYVATALHAQRTLFLTRAAPGRFAADPRRQLMLRDSLIQLGRLQTCQNEQVGQHTQRHVQLAYEGAVAAKLNIQAMDFWLSPQNTLQKMRVRYQAGGPLKQVTLSFLVQEWLTSSAQLPADARARVVDSQGRPLPAFQGYHLVNQITPAR